MALSDHRWQTINPSAFPWEREALDFVREGLPDRTPYRAWSNFEFVAQDGSINEVDLLVLGPDALYLVEIKSRPGELAGDAATWTWTTDGRRVTHDNPLLLADRKARRLAGLLHAHKAFRSLPRPYVQALVFCSSPALKVSLDERGRQHVCLRDARPGESPARPGILARLMETRQPGRPRVDLPLERAVSQAVAQLGIRPRQGSRSVGDFRLDTLIGDGPGWQDWRATHVALEKVRRRVRLYPVAVGAGTLSRRTLERAAQREFQILEGLRHPGIVAARAFTLSERGPALVFDHDPGEVRLDHFLRERGAGLSVDVRLDLLRQVAEALKYAHEHKLFHRALSPHSILVLDADGPRPRACLFNWQTGRRDPGSSAPPGTVGTHTSHLGELVEEAARVYVAPEALDRPDADPEPLDVFSLGTLAYLLFSGEAPASDALALAEKLRVGHGLRLDALVDGAGAALENLVFFATCADVVTRLGSVDAFLDGLTEVEEELTRPDPGAMVEALAAGKGDLLEGGFEVVRRLGKGSSAVALLVQRDGEQRVLKIATDPAHDERLRAEGELLRSLPRQQHVCALHDVLTVGGRTALLMDLAGPCTLAQRLRDEGRLHVDLLERFGDDLLATLDWLEQQGVAHRDIKPDNIGIAPVGRGDSLHLVLFDFSLARTPAENVRAGTVPYLDPFLRTRREPRWDSHAERFAAAMTLHEMATGTLPVWGDGRADPAAIPDEVTLDGARFDPDLRAPLLAFFHKALARDYEQRFGNTREMLGAWRDVFRGLRPAALPVETSGEVLPAEALAQATLEAPLAQLGLGTRALNALDRAGVVSVRDLLELPPMAVAGMRGVGGKTRREIGLVQKRLHARFPDVEPRAPRRPAAAAPAAAAGAGPARDVSLDGLHADLVPAGRGRASSEAAALEALLGLAAPAGGGASWPSQIDAARGAGVTRARVGQIVAKARARWASDARLVALADDVAALLPARGGVMTAVELAGALLVARGSVAVDPGERLRRAAAVARAVVEAEQARPEPRFLLSRRAGLLLVASGDAPADYAVRLGREADQLAREDPPAAPSRVLEVLQRVPPPATGEPLPPARLVALAAAASESAAVSSRLELYPRGLDPLRALQLAQGALLGAALLGPDEVSRRVLGRYPEAQALPGRPALDALLAQAGLDLVWDAAEGGYRSPGRPASSSVTSFQRLTTAPGRPGDVTPEAAEARQFQDRLAFAFRHGGFLALSVDPRRQQDAEDELLRQFEGLQRRSLEALLIEAMREKARVMGAAWDVVRRADAAPRDAADWRNLTRLARDAAGEVERALVAGEGRLLLVHPGLLARYDQVDLLGRLREALDRPSGLHALWLLVPADAAHERPVLEGRPVPVIGPGQWARIPESWLQNRHRGQAPSAA